MPSSDISSVWSGQHGLTTIDAKSEFVALDYNSRLRVVSAIQSSDSECMQSLGSIEYLSELTDFRVPSYGSGFSVRN